MKTAEQAKMTTEDKYIDYAKSRQLKIADEPFTSVKADTVPIVSELLSGQAQFALLRKQQSFGPSPSS